MDLPYSKRFPLLCNFLCLTKLELHRDLARLLDNIGRRPNNKNRQSIALKVLIKPKGGHKCQNGIVNNSKNGWITPVEFEHLHQQSLEEPCVY